MKNLHFESVNKITPKYEAFPISMLDFEHDYARENEANTSQCMHKLKRERNIGCNQGSKHFKPLFMGVKTFIQTLKKGDVFFVYAILALDPRMQQHEIPIQYQNYKK